MRINKFLSAVGHCSRREADRLLSESRVRINEKTASLGEEIGEADLVYVDNRPVGGLDALKQKEPVVLAVHKPVGIVCTASDKDRAPNIVDMVSYPRRVYPVGRLDKDSEGLILMTDDGRLVNALLKASQYHEKEYVVTVDKPLSPEDLKKMEKGVYLPGLKVKTRPCRVEPMGGKTFCIILTQGYNRQIRRMCAVFGRRVLRLRRIRILHLHLKGIEKGRFRLLRKEEMRILYQTLGIQ